MNKCMWIAGIGGLLGACLVATPNANAALNYSVSNTSAKNCDAGAPSGSADGSHGLWTNPGNNLVSSANCGDYFSVNPGSTLTIDDSDADPANWTGALVGTATNPNGIQASFDITLDVFAETSTEYKDGGGPYDPLLDDPDIDFFTHGSGSITVDGVQYDLLQPDPWAMDFVFQVGPGANDKDLQFGASAWVLLVDPTGQPLSHHMDLNLVLSAVPEPASLGVLGFGLLGLGFAARRRRRQAI